MISFKNKKSTALAEKANTMEKRRVVMKPNLIAYFISKLSIIMA